MRQCVLELLKDFRLVRAKVNHFGFLFDFFILKHRLKRKSVKNRRRLVISPERVSNPRG